MAVERIKVPLSEEEYEALPKLSEAEVRPMNDQIRYLVAQELRRRGLLSPARIEPLAACGVQ